MTAHDVDRAAGAVLRRMRLEKGLSQPDLAEPIGISYQQIQKYETAANRISTSMLFDLANVLQIAPAALVDAIEKELKRAPAADH